VKSLLLAILCGWGALSVSAAFTSYYVFGDGLSCTATNPQAGQFYYGKRFSNGRVWVEVLAQQQGLALNPAGNTNAFFGNTSANLTNEVNRFVISPAAATNALVVIWVNNADLYFPALADTPTLDGFLPYINQGKTNHYIAITNLYAKGIRTLVMPNVVDVSTIPAFNTSQYTNVFHQASVAYNDAFYAVLNQIKSDTNYPGLKIIIPDYYTLLNNLLSHPDQYGVTNVLVGGLPMDAIDAYNYGLPVANTNGYGTNYIFWDQKNPTALVHAIMASVAQQMLSPAQIGKITAFNGSNRLDLANVPVYTNVPMNALVLSCTNLSLGNWTTNLTFSTTNTAPSVFVTNSGAPTFYRLKFPYVWAWP
jgi:phospholipase/lecithinase/hemolysin